MRNNILCDFDGTISAQDTTDLALSAYAAPEWKILEQEWLAGKMGSRECMQRQVALLDASLAELDALLDGVEVDPFFVEFATFCRQHNIQLTIASDGVDYFIRRILGRLGLADLPVRANNLIVNPDGGYALSSPYQSDQCKSRAGHCKCTSARNDEEQLNILIGDGRSDFCLAHVADMVIAKKSLLTYCQQQEIPHLAFNHFGDVKNHLTAMLIDERAYPSLQTPVLTA